MIHRRIFSNSNNSKEKSEELIDGESCPGEGECRGDPSESIEVMVGQTILANRYALRHGRVAPTPRLTDENGL